MLGHPILKVFTIWLSTSDRNSKKERDLPEEVVKPMGEATATLEPEAVEETVHIHLVLCPRCGCDRIKRIARLGLLHKYVFPVFGRFPWRCARCGATSLMKRRTMPKRHRRHSRHAEQSTAKSVALETQSTQ